MRRRPDNLGPTSRGITDLHLCSYHNRLEELTSLLGQGTICVDAKSNSGQTPLHFAAWKNNPQAAKILIQHGANHESVDDQGCTPLDKAREYNSIHVIDVLGKASEILAAKRQADTARKKLISVLRSDYVHAHVFFITHCARFLPESVFEQEQALYVQEWLRARKIR